MSSMVLSQLLNSDAGLDRKPSGQLPDLTTGEKGPSRYDEIVRQQEKRLAQKRVEERNQTKADLQAQRDARRAEKAESSRQAEVDRQKNSANPAERQDVRRERVSDKTQHAADNIRSVDDDPVLDEEALHADPAMVTGMPPQTFAGPLNPGNGGGALTNPLQGGGALPGTGTTAGMMFAALLNADGESGTGANLLGTLQGGGTQPGGESAGRFAGLLMTTATSPELTQSLSQPGAVRGAEAQALMRGYATSVDTPVGQSEWGEKVMGKLAWLTASQMAVAEIHVTPPELGPLDVRVQVQNDQATVTVHASTPAVREQLELHGHRLREMLSEQGFSLEGFDVTDSAGRHSADQEGSDDSGQDARVAQQGEVDGTSGSDAVETGSLDLSWRGEVDVFV